MRRDKIPDWNEAVAVPVEPVLDLHTFDPRELKPLLEDYLEEAHERGWSQVLIIHGKGRGVLRHRVRALLARHPRVAAYHDAPPTLGSWGATLVHLNVDKDGNIQDPATGKFFYNLDGPLGPSAWLWLGVGVVLGVALGAVWWWLR
ncbi:Smr/MutS family protein [Desulfosoma caldarium]|uniref:Smr domain-containing protein n=1 Tax=Desulfosoma caldarium TaxID=610254 RepID=A0A3N1UI46_9BACT|nr:Smr/MutS family protein [Desulfosoma caldarium]ROQ89793.1 Smr domain-containing protein [Desulfosoma caldarium]